MIKLEFEGTHYEIGYNWGRNLKLHGINVLAGVPFPITKKKIAFAEECLPHYQKYFPEVLEEIKGIAHGQEVEFNQLTTVLFNMYCLTPSTNCSCFVSKSTDGVLLGRNSDFLTAIEELYLNTIYRFESDSYSFNGNTTAFVEMEDGINQHGLAVGLTSVGSKNIQAGINAGFLVRLFLEKCATVDQCLKLLDILPIASGQTLVIGDRSGDAVMVECNSQFISSIRLSENTTAAYSVNEFNTPELKEYHDLPRDTWHASERYETLKNYFANRNSIALEDAMSLLRGDEGFICQYDRRTGKDTMWSVVYDLNSSRVYRAEGNPSRVAFQLDSRQL